MPRPLRINKHNPNVIIFKESFKNNINLNALTELIKHDS